MKKIFNILLATTAFLVWANITKAADPPTTPPYIDDGVGIAYNKTVSAPNENGVYTITLESFATGSIVKTSKAVPADIVLVLDISGSMSDSFSGGQTKLEALKTAVNTFIDLINTNDTENAPAGKQRLGNRIAIVPFATDITNYGTNRIRDFRTMDQAQAMKTNVNALRASGGTYAHRGMNQALTYLSGSSSQLKTVVLFTDGNPGLWGKWTSNVERSYPSFENIIDTDWAEQYTEQSGWSTQTRYRTYENVDTYNSANATINYANQIKNLAVESDDPDKQVISNVFTVSIINNPSNQTKVYLGKTSSNWLGADNMGWYTDNWDTLDNSWGYNHNNGSIGEENTSSTNFALTASSASDLVNAFATIAGESGGSTRPMDDTTITEVDVVSSSFKLPTGTTASKIKVYTAPCTGKSGDYLTFGSWTLAPDSDEQYRKREIDPATGHSHEVGELIDIDDNITVKIDASVEGGPDDMIVVNGFDYGNLFCGEVIENGTTTYRGYKLIVEIPIEMNPDAVGGPNVESNATGSGILIDGEQVLEFKSPTVSLPVNIYITKEGLEIGESAKFKIERAALNEDGSVPENPSWTYVSTIFLTKKSDGDDPIVKVRGLPSTQPKSEGSTEQIGLVYRITEENWGWSYIIDSDSQLTVAGKVDNPFTFTNEKRTDVDPNRYAESKATNDFTAKIATYTDSKGR